MAEDQATFRLHRLLWLLLGWAGLIFVRLVWLQVIHHDDLLRLAQQQQQKMQWIPALRGTIFDRNGQALAKSLPAESVCVNPQKISDPAMAADLLSQALNLDRAKLQEKIEDAKLRGSGFLWVKRKIMEDEAGALRSLNLPWVEFRPEIRRFYPHHMLAAHVLGSMGMTDSGDTEEHGTAGIEESFDEDLAGRPGLARVYTDVKQNPYDSVVARQPEPGADLTLTIDSNLQYDAEKALQAAVARTGAKTGSVVAMNPYTGEILALANYPAYDPNLPPAPGEPENARSDLAVTTPFEPGSVFKTVTLAAALETTNLRPDTIIDCGNGVITLFGRVIHDTHRYGALTMEQVYEKSSNIGAIHIGLRVGNRTMYQYIKKFGFGARTGIELPGESAGEVRRVENWTPSSIGSVAMGHEVSTTSVQLAVMAAAIANGGLKVKPQIVMARHQPGESEEKFAPEKPKRILQPETAITMRQLMEGVVLRGTGRVFATLKGYTSGGKTGSAQVYDLKAHAYTHKYNASFIGFAPVVNPQIVIAVTLNDTAIGSAGFGGPAAAPVFREVAMTGLRILDVPKDLPDNLKPASAKPSDYNDLAIAGLGDAPDARSSEVVSSVTQSPPASEGALSKAPDESRRQFFSAAVVGPKVPDFHGMTLRAVLEESSARGMPVETVGTPDAGLVRNQDPPAGTILPAGERIRLEFAK
ncbi:MAG TPA: penicillin-binding protein [Bryobacteraceae bacterium]|jgi:cell division protein FtsI (penicillin-binding protein 3)|nr:penicillin-binding protein [Bryobacteraceae bacterium]